MFNIGEDFGYIYFYVDVHIIILIIEIFDFFKYNFYLFVEKVLFNVQFDVGTLV